MTHRDDVEFIEVVLQAIALLIPGHGPFQGGHGMGCVSKVTRFHVDAQGHRPSTDRCERVSDFLQPARHEGEEIGGFGKGVVPDCVVARGAGLGIWGQLSGFDAVAVAEQHRTVGPIGLQAHPKATQQVGSVGMEGDAAEPLRFALGGKQPSAHIQPFQGGVGMGLNPHPASELKWRGGGGGDPQLALAQAELISG